MPSIFKYKEDRVTIQGPDRSARTLIPNEDGNVINVIEKFPWTLTPFSSPARIETPYIKLKEFYLLDSYINQLLKSYNLQPLNPTAPILDAFSTLTNLGVLRNIRSEKQLYDGLYDHDNPTGFEYKFPYFESCQTNVNTWTRKSTYDFIVGYQQKFAAFTEAENLMDLVRSYFPAPLAATINAAVGSIYSPDVVESAANLMVLPASSPVLDTARLAGAFAARVGLAALPAVGPTITKLLQTYEEKIAPGIAFARRAAELVQIALDSSMGNLQGDPVIDKPLIWTSSQPRNFVISFPLFNTDVFGDTNAEKMITRNWELCYLLAYQNLYNKKNLYKGTPPVFYEIEVPGIHYTKAGYVNDLKILNIGNTRLLDLPIGSDGERRSVNVPDAYFVTMSLIDFFMPSKNFLDTINNPTARSRVKRSWTGATAQQAPEDNLPFSTLPDIPNFPGIPNPGAPSFPGVPQLPPDSPFNQPGGSIPDPGFNQPGGTGGIDLLPGPTD